jgi:hypothetical protein
MTETREARIADVVGAVARQALADCGLHRIALLDDGGPEAELATRMLARTLGPGAILRVREDGEDLDHLHRFRTDGAEIPGWRMAEEVRRLRTRLMDGTLPAHPASKTALLLGGALPPEPLLPLADLWATEVAALIGGWSAPPPVLALAEAAGGIEALDDALRRRFDGRETAAFDALPSAVAETVRQALVAGRASRRDPRMVPKLGRRTLCIDLME